jgi:hypothetical protein
VDEEEDEEEDDEDRVDEDSVGFVLLYSSITH